MNWTGWPSRAYPRSRLRISDRAHVLMPYHRDLDRLEEEARGAHRLGTTGRGVGPAYVDKAARDGIRWPTWPTKTGCGSGWKRWCRANPRFCKSFTVIPATPWTKCTTTACATPSGCAAAGRRGPAGAGRAGGGTKSPVRGRPGRHAGHRSRHVPVRHRLVTRRGRHRPGRGRRPRAVANVLGVAKAYTTRVGLGPFPTELADEAGDAIRERGAEYGTTTGRPRRCGWLDAVQLRYAARVSGLRQLVLTKLDVLSGFDPVRICVAYEIDGRRVDRFPASLYELSRAVPIYEEHPGWSEELTHVASAADLPDAARGVHPPHRGAGGRAGGPGVGGARPRPDTDYGRA